MQLEGKWLTFDEKAHRCVSRTGASHLLTKNLPEGWL
jgi:hypothetical protein